MHILSAAIHIHHKRARWYIVGKECKIDNVKLKIITFVINLIESLPPLSIINVKIKAV